MEPLVCTSACSPWPSTHLSYTPNPFGGGGTFHGPSGVRLPTRRMPSVAVVPIMGPAGRPLTRPTLSAEEEPLMVLAEQRLTPRIRLEAVGPLADSELATPTVT